MKRAVLEWGLILSLGTLLTLSALWVGSYFIDRSSSHFRIADADALRNDLHILVGDGNIWLSDQIDDNPPGDIKPSVVDPRTHIAPKIRRIGHLTIPGIDLRYCQFTPDGYMVWSLKLSLLFPVALALLAAALFRRRLKGLRGGMSPPA